MAKTAEFQIVINGLKESISAVESLNAQLDGIEKRLDAISKMSINVNTSKSSRGGSEGLEAEEKLQRQIINAEDKIIAARTDEYQILLQQKAEFKEINELQKANVANARLQDNAYANTMQGIKQKMADLKAVMQTMDLGDDKFVEMAKQINDLNNQLKTIEQSYGQYGRNVGNYAGGVAEGLGLVTVKVGDVDRTFKSASAATRTLKNELKALSIEGKRGTKEWEELNQALIRTRTAIDGTSAGINKMMKVMEGFTGMAQIGTGISALFGFDDSAIQQSIQKLMALQNMLQGIQTIIKQMSENRGLGNMLNTTFGKIDQYNFSMKRLIVSLQGTGTAAKVAATGVNLLSKAIKGIASLGLALVIDGLIEGAKQLINMFTKWVKGNAELVDSEKLVQAQIEYTNRKLDERRSNLEKDYLSGAITEEQYYQAVLKATTEAISEQIEEVQKLRSERLDSGINERMQGIDANKGKDIAGTWGLNVQAETLDELTKAWKKYYTAIEHGKDVVSDNDGNWLKSLWITLDDTKDTLTEIGQVAIGEFINRYKHAMETMKTDTKKGEAEIRELQKLMNSNEMMHNVLTHLDQYIPEKETIALLQNIINKIKEIPTAIDGDQTKEQILRSEQLRIDAMKDGAAKRQAQRNLDMKKELADTTLTEQDKANIRKKYQNRREKEETEAAEKAARKAKANAKEASRIEQSIAKARIDAMKQGLTKTLAQLQLERNRRIEEAKKTGHMVAEQIELINRDFYRKEFDARVKYHTDLLNEEKRYAKELASLQADTWQRELDSSQMMYERELQEKINKVTEVVGEGSKSDRINALTYSYETLIGHTDSLVKKYAELRQAVYEADTVMKMFAEDSSTLDINGKTIDVWEKQLEDAKKKLDDFYKENPAFKQLEDASIIPDIKAAIDVRLQIRRDYYKQLEKYSDEYYKKEKARIAEEIDTETQELINAEKERHDALVSMFDNDNNILNTKNGNIPLKAFTKQFKELMGQDILKGQSESDIGWYFQTYREEFNKWIDEMPKKLKKGEIAIEDYIEYTGSTLYQSYIKTKNDFDNFMEQYNKTYKTATGGQKEKLDAEMKEWTDKMNMAFVKYFKQIESEYEEHENRMKVIQKQGNEQLKKANQESLESQQKNTIAYYSNMATEYERAMSSIRNKMGNRETNDWGIINYTKERQNLKTLQEANTNVMNKIAKDKEELVQKLKDNKITFEDFDAAMDRLNTMGVQAMDMGEQLTQEMKELPGEWWRGIDQWLQQIGQAVSSIIQSLAEINDAALQNEIDAIDKQTELLQEALDKQKEITQKHADDVNDIEDELASARGDRRQFLIDQLNAEMQAQRESLAQQKQMEKEKEALDKKRDDLEFQQKMNQWNASKLTAMINAALAISAAAVNTYPIPAVPMMALAASVGAAQVAAVMAAKPKRYASGGLLEGPDHKHGGIPVGNTGLEVEGHEYVIRKESSIPNLDLLSYINRKKRKLSLDDFIDFYSKNSIKGSIERVRPKYANGGQLPTLRNDIDINNRLITAIDDFANKQTVVSVVDIINKADNVRQVRALSGLKQN